MTATVQVPEVAKVLELADRRFAARAGDDPATPEYLAVLTRAVQQQVIDQLPAGVPVAIDTHELDNLRVDYKRSGEIVAELRRELSWKDGQLSTAQIAAAGRDEEYKRQRDRQVAELADALDERDAALKVRDEARRAIEDLATANANGHHHTYEWTGPAAEPSSCPCGQPYPRGAIRHTSTKPSAPEPFAELFGKIRAQLSGVDGWSEL
jgi:hypothetical protein